MNSELSAERVNVVSLEDYKLKGTVEDGKLSKDNSMFQYQLDLLKAISGFILRKAGNLRLRNRSLEASVGLGRSATSPL